MPRKNGYAARSHSRRQRRVNPTSLRIYHMVEFEAPRADSDDLLFLRSGLQKSYEVYGARAPVRAYVEEMADDQADDRNLMKLVLLDSNVPSNYKRPTNIGYQMRDIGRIRTDIEDGLHRLGFPSVGLQTRFNMATLLSEVVENPKPSDSRIITLVPDPEHPSTDILHRAHELYLDKVYHRKREATGDVTFVPNMPVAEVWSGQTDVTPQDVVQFITNRLNISVVLAPPTFVSEQRLRAWDN